MRLEGACTVFRRMRGGKTRKEARDSGLVRRVISDGSERNGLLARKVPNTAGANILARDAAAGGARGCELNFR